MFAQFNYDKFPLVLVNFNESITNEEFDNFLKTWLILYQNKTDFSFIFDTRGMGIISPLYSIKMALFIKKLRKQEYHYLQKSLIIVNDNRIRNLLDIIFTLQAPVAPVYLWLTDSQIIEDIYKRCEESNIENLTNDMIYIKPNI